MDRILVDDVMDYLKDAVYDGINEDPDSFPIFNKASSLMLCLNDYSLKDFDNRLFDKVILEVINYLKI